MANPFLDDEPNKSKGKNPFMDDVVPSAPPVQDTKSWGRNDSDPWYAVGARKADDFFRAFNRALTFGAYDRVVDAASGGNRQQRLSEEAAAESPYTTVAGSMAGSMLPAAKISQGIGATGRLIGGPAANLAKNTFSGVAANNAITGATMAAADDVIRNGEAPSLSRVGTEALLGAAVSPAILAGQRAFSAAARVRSAGSGLSEADKAAAQKLAEESAMAGIPLNVPEAINAVAPGRSADVNAVFESGARSPKGAQNLKNFNDRRAPVVEASTRKAVTDLGPGADPFVANSDANKAINAERTLWESRVSPLYQKAYPDQVSFNPTPARSEAFKTVKEDPIIIDALQREARGPLSDSSVLMLDAVKKEMDAMYSSAAGRDQTHRAGIIADDISNLLSTMDAASPNYAAARAEGGKAASAIKRLRGGPLGKVANTVEPAGHSQAMFGVSNDVEKGLASDALNRIGPTTARGILANKVGSAVSNGADPLPTPEAQDLARQVLGADWEPLNRLLTGRRAMQNTQAPLPQHEHTGPLGSAWNAARNFRRGATVDILNDPSNIKLLGEVGSVGRGAIATGQGVIDTVTDEEEKKRRRRNGGGGASK